MVTTQRTVLKSKVVGPASSQTKARTNESVRTYSLRCSALGARDVKDRLILRHQFHTSGAKNVSNYLALAEKKSIDLVNQKTFCLGFALRESSHLQDWDVFVLGTKREQTILPRVFANGMCASEYFLFANWKNGRCSFLHGACGVHLFMRWYSFRMSQSQQDDDAKFKLYTLLLSSLVKLLL